MERPGSGICHCGSQLSSYPVTQADERLSMQKKKSKGPRRPKYQGAWAPNRFAIAPGFRWDGVGGYFQPCLHAIHSSRGQVPPIFIDGPRVPRTLLTCFADRSNGFEKKFFQYQNAAARNTYEQNQWSVEDM